MNEVVLCESSDANYNDANIHVIESSQIPRLDGLSHIHDHLPTTTQPIMTVPSESDEGRSDSAPNITSFEDTIKEWRRRGAKIAFIYDLILDKYRGRLDFFTLLAFLLTALTSLLALGNFGLSEVKYPNLTMSLKAVNVILTTGAAICAGIVRLRGWNQLIDSCQKYLDTVEHFVALIISEQSLPVRLRIDSEQFILQQKDKFHAILNSAPDISHDDYIQALDCYVNAKTRFRYDLINV